MKIYLFNTKGHRGSVLVVALLILVAGTIGMTSMTTLVGNRSRFVLDSELSVKRRLALRNSRALARHYFMRQAIATSGTARTISLSSDTSWGKIVIPATTSAFASNQNFSLVNRLSPGDESGFTEDVDVTIQQAVPYSSPAAESSIPYRVQLKSRSPILAGNLFIQHKPTKAVIEEVDVGGSIRVNGHAVFWTDGNIGSSDVSDFVADSYDYLGPDPFFNVALPDSGGNSTAASNFPIFTRTTGLTSTATGAPAVTDGSFNIIELGNSSPESLNTLLYKIDQSSPTTADGNFSTEYPVGAVSGAMVNDTGGGPQEMEITVNLDDTAVSPVKIEDGVHHVRLQGYTDAGQGDNEPTAFILIRSADLETVVLENSNYRRLVLGIECGNAISFSATTPSSTWRAILTIEQAPVYLDFGSSGMTIQGGVRTDARFVVQSGNSLIINRDPNPGPLELIDTREAWIEIYPPPPTP